MSIKLCSSVSVLLKLVSSVLYPQVSLIVMQVSQSLPGYPVAGMVCSGVSVSPGTPPPMRLL